MRRFRLFLLLLSAALLCTACGGEKTPAQQTTDAVTTKQTETTASGHLIGESQTAKHQRRDTHAKSFTFGRIILFMRTFFVDFLFYDFFHFCHIA